MYIRTPYTKLIATSEQSLNLREDVCKDVRKSSVFYYMISYVYCILLHDTVRIFAHPTRSSSQHVSNSSTRPMTCVGCQKVFCILLHAIVCVFSHPTYPCLECQKALSESRSLMYSAAWYRAYIRTPYTPGRGVSKMQQSLMYSAA